MPESRKKVIEDRKARIQENATELYDVLRDLYPLVADENHSACDPSTCKIKAAQVLLEKIKG